MILSSLLFVASGVNLGPEALLVNLTGSTGVLFGTYQVMNTLECLILEVQLLKQDNMKAKLL